MGEVMSELKPCPSFLRRSEARSRHGHTRGRKYSPTYQTWMAMLSRCRYLDRDVSAKHIGRGIKVDPRWEVFENFLADMGERPDGLTIERIDNDGDYRPGNCRWATATDQARNRRNARLTYESAVEVCLMMLSGSTAKAVAGRFGCSESLPREVLKGRSWKDASGAAHAIWERDHD